MLTVTYQKEVAETSHELEVYSEVHCVLYIWDPFWFFATSFPNMDRV